MSSHGRTGRRSGHPQTRLEIIEAAREMFSERGYAGTSIPGVAASAGVDPALVHHYFGTKEGLFRAVLEMPINPSLFSTRCWPTARRMRLGGWWRRFLRRVLAEQESTNMVRDFIGAAGLRTAADRLLGDVAPAEARARIGLVVSQMLDLVVLRKVLLVEPIASTPPTDLTSAVAPTIARYLHGELTVLPVPLAHRVP